MVTPEEKALEKGLRGTIKVWCRPIVIALCDRDADLGDKTVACALRNGISEGCDSVSGKKLGVEYPGMTCTVITMMLDGLSREHRLQIKEAR